MTIKRKCHNKYITKLKESLVNILKILMLISWKNTQRNERCLGTHNLPTSNQKYKTLNRAAIGKDIEAVRKESSNKQASQPKQSPVAGGLIAEFCQTDKEEPMPMVLRHIS